ncbi:MAG: TIGR03790 family protein, partial [Roseibacillus sp.]|nr:TIGR03790 family protein [Roseibacillus sp.]
MNRTAGIPCVVDRNIDTYVTNYPMSDAALYFGWYSHHRNGPLLNDSFRFKRGAIAIHLHSYSAFELRDPDQRWCGPILARGATATVGNVYEPFLSLTHYFNILHHRLLSGYTVGEASCMALPVLSWQAVLLGDPLYRPFPADLKINLSDRVDRDYKALRHAQSQWGNEEGTLITKLRTYANKANSGTVFEALGLLARADGNEEEANAFFTVAREKYSSEVDQLRQDLHIVDVYREAGNKKTAILLLKKIRENISPIPGQGAVTALLNILDPPAPPPVRLRQKR